MKNDCSEWVEIDAFRSRREYEFLVNWLDSLISQGIVLEVEVTQPYANSRLFDERWLLCLATNEVWRFVAPEPPFKGLFERVDKDE